MAKEEMIVAVPLSDYTEMVRQIQMLTDQIEIDRLKREHDEMEDKYHETLYKFHCLEQKYKEAIGEK